MSRVTPYVKTNWEDTPSTSSPINSIHLNHLETGVKNVTDAVNEMVVEVEPATPSKLGGIKVGSGLSVTQDGTLSANAQALEPATASKLGGIKVGSNLSITQDGTLSADTQQYTLPPATQNTLGGIKVGSRLSVTQDGTLSADSQQYTLPPATQSTLGGIKVGSNLSITQDGTLSANGGGGGASELNDLDDVEVSNPSSGQMLKYNATTSKFENSDIDIPNELSYSATMTILNTTVPPLPDPIPSFAEAKDAQIAAIMANHYAGNIDIHDYWSVGDFRTVNLSASTDYASYEQPAGQLTMILADSEREDLTTPEGNITKAAFSVCILPNLIYGCPLHGNTSISAFTDSDLYAWLNNSDGFINMFSNDLKGVFRLFDYGITGSRYSCKFTVPIDSDFYSSSNPRGIEFLISIFGQTGNVRFAKGTKAAQIAQILGDAYSQSGEYSTMWTSSELGAGNTAEYMSILMEYNNEDDSYVYYDISTHMDYEPYTDEYYIIPYCVI